MANTYDDGESVVLQGTFKNTAGVPTTPSAYTLYIERPNGTIVTVPQGSITVVSTGVLEYADIAAGHGLHFYRFVGTLAGRAVIEQNSYWVRAPRAVPA